MRHLYSHEPPHHTPSSTSIVYTSTSDDQKKTEDLSFLNHLHDCIFDQKLKQSGIFGGYTNTWS